MMDREAILSLNRLLTDGGLEVLDDEVVLRFAEYLSLLLRWNRRVNLTSIRDEEGILRWHFAESIAVARILPEGIKTFLDFGSGAGLPGIPIALCRPEIAVTLAESKGKKAAFLREAVRTLGICTEVFAGRAEDLKRQFDGVTLRAVDRMEDALAAAVDLVRPGGWLAPMTTRSELSGLERAAGPQISWMPATQLPGGEDRILALGRRNPLGL